MLLYQVVSGLAAAYFASKNHRFVTVLNCWSDYENTHLYRALSEESIASNIMISSANANISQIIDNLLGNKHSKKGVILQFDCAASVEIIRACSTAKLFSQTFYWLIYDGRDVPNRSQSSYVLNELNRTNLHVDTEITYADWRQAQRNQTVWHVPLFDVYNNGYHAGGSLRVNYDGYFTVDSMGDQFLSPALTDRTPKYVRRMDLGDLSLRVGTVYQIIDNRELTTESILDHLMSQNNTQFDVLNRPTFQMALHVQELLAYKPIWVHHPLWSLNDTYGGALGDIIAGNTDIAYVLAGLSWNRLAYMHPIVEMRDFRSVFLFRTFGSQKSGLIENVFFKPFHATVWYTLAVCIGVLAIGMYAVHRREFGQRSDEKLGPVESNFNPNLEHQQQGPSAHLSAATALGAFCQQGAAELVPRSANGRYLLLVLYGASILTYTYYTTEVLSALIGSPVQTNIRTLAQLALSSMSVGLENVSHTTTYLTITNTPDLQLLKERKLNPIHNASQVWTSLAAGLDRVRRGGHAYHCEDTHAYAYIRRTFEPIEMCDLNEIYLRPKLQVGYMSNKRSPYLELFKTKFRKFRETGLASKYNRLWLPAKPACMVDSFVFSVGMEYVGPLFVFLAGAMVLCALLLLGEWVHWRMRRSRRGRQRRAAEAEAAAVTLAHRKGGMFGYGYQP